MNAIDLLKEDHDVVDTLFTKVEDTPPSRHRALFTKIKGELDTHAHIEEKIFYPALLKKGDKELVDIVKEGIEEHRQIKAFLKELDAITPKNDTFEPKIKVLIEDTRHHVKEEENEMFPLVERQFTSTELTKLGERMEAQKKKFHEANNIKPASRARAKGPIAKIVDKAIGAVTDALASPSTAGRTAGKAKGTGQASSKGGTASRKGTTASGSNGKQRPAPSTASRSKPAAKPKAKAAQKPTRPAGKKAAGK